MKKKNALEEYELAEEEAFAIQMEEETIEEVHSTIDWSEFGQEFEKPGLADEDQEEAQDLEEENQEESEAQEEAQANKEEKEEKPKAKKTSTKKKSSSTPKDKKSDSATKKKTSTGTKTKKSKKEEPVEDKKDEENPVVENVTEPKEEVVNNEQPNEEATTNPEVTENVASEETKEEATPIVNEEPKEEVKEEEAAPKVEPAEAPTEEVKEETKEEVSEEAPIVNEEPKEEVKEEEAAPQVEPTETPSEEVKEETKEEVSEETPIVNEEAKEEVKEEEAASQVEPTEAPTEEVKEEVSDVTPTVTQEVKEEVKEEPKEEAKEEKAEEPMKPVRPPFRKMVRPESRKETKVFTLNKQPKAQMPTLPKNKLKKEALVTEDKDKIVELLNKGISEGFTYLFTPATDFNNNVVYIQLHQCVEIDENTRIMEEVFAPVAEENDLIFQTNKLAIEKTLEEAKKKVDIKFAVNLSTKYLSSQEKIDELAELLARCPSNIILIIDAIKVKDCDEEQVARLYDLLNKTNLRMMLDNVEDARVSLLFELPVYYLRIDGDYYIDRTPAQTSLLSFYASFTKNAKIHLSCKNINELSQVAFINKYSKRIEGDAVMSARLSVNDIQSSLRKK